MANDHAPMPHWACLHANTHAKVQIVHRTEADDDAWTAGCRSYQRSSSQLPTSQHPWQCCNSPSYILQVAMLL